MVAEETLEPSSFKRGRMLTEMRVLERIEERLELVVEGRSFPIRLSEADTFLCGPRYSCPHDSQASSTNSERMEDHSQGVPVEQEDLVDVVRQFDCDKGNVEVEVEGADSKSGEAIAVEGVVLWLRGGKMTYERVLERFLTREKLHADKQVKKGKGRHRKAMVSSSSIAGISLSDADFQCRQSAILKEANSTVEFGNLLGVKTIEIIHILSWNVRGLGSQIKRKAIRSLLRKQCIDMIFLVETKLEVVLNNVIKSIWWTDVFRYYFVPSLGSSGGIIIIWEQNKFELVDVCRDPNFLSVRGTWCLEEWKCDMVVFYAPCEIGAQTDLWSRLLAETELIALPVSCGGDFNAVLCQAERRNCLGYRRSMLSFNSFLDDSCLVNLLALGKAFTWYGGRTRRAV
ncbi:hypothetical protein V6N13_138279 [Hibiscus sabdariffa]